MCGPENYALEHTHTHIYTHRHMPTKEDKL